MKKLTIIALIFLMTASLSFAHEESFWDKIEGSPFQMNDKKYEFKDDYIKIFDKDYSRDDIYITDTYDLYINNRKINLDRRSRSLIKSYYKELFDIREKAIEIGIEGAKIGLSGAKLGLTAVVSLPLLLVGGSDEYEERMERSGEELERKGERLEKRGDRLEEQAEDLENIEWELKERIAELDHIDWF
ncbi:MAG: hypothetical protein ACLFQM_01325 [Fidelibacterota bacterium]